MIGLSLNSLTLRRPVVLPGIDPGDGADGSPSDPPSGEVKGYVLEEDGPVEARLAATDEGVAVEVTAPQSMVGRYEVSDAALAEGLPVWLIPPTAEEAPAGTWTVRDDGLYLAPAEDPVATVVTWERNGTHIREVTGNRYVRDDVVDDEVELAWQARLVNSATPQGGGVTVRSVVQAAVQGTSSAFAVTHRTDLTHSATDEPDAGRVMLVFNGRFTERAIVDITGILDPSGPRRTPFLLRQLASEDSPFRMDTVLRTADGGDTLLQQIATVDLDAFGVANTVNEDLCLVVLLDAEAGWAEMWVGINGHPLVRASRRSVPFGSRIEMAPHTWFIGRPDQVFRHPTVAIRRLAVWSASTLPDLSRPGASNVFQDGSGFPKGLARLNALVGDVAPLFAFGGDAARAEAGDHDGTWGGFASVGPDRIEEFTE